MAKATEKQVEAFFSHDINARNSTVLLKIKFELGHEGKSVFWDVVEFMHSNEFPVTFLPVLAKHLDTSTELLEKLMSYEELFYVEDEKYKNNRILRNLEYRKEKTDKKAEAASKGHLLKTFVGEYNTNFGENPILTDAEIKKLYSYLKTITNLKELLPDVIYTMSTLKFDNDFRPRANWLLKESNLAKIVNGEFGKLKSRTAKEDAKTKANTEEEANIQRAEEDAKARRHQFAHTSDKHTALDWITKYIPQTMIKKSADAQELITKYDLQIEDIKKAYEAKDV